MEGPANESTPCNDLKSGELSDVTLHAKERNLIELHKLDSLNEMDSSQVNLATNPSSTTHGGIPGTDVGLDDILPSESFSAQASREGSLVGGVVSRKPSISVFEQPLLEPDPTQPSHEPTECLPSSPQSCAPLPHPRPKHDIPRRYSDVEGSPPLRAAGFVGDEIPHVDPLDSNCEWEPIPTVSDLPTRFVLIQGAPINNEGQQTGSTEERKKKKRKKKSKAVISPLDKG